MSRRHGKQINRGGLYALIAGVVVAGIMSASPALAQSYPSKPIRILVGFAPGGPSDIIARVVGAKTGEIMGAQFIVENKTGAGGAIATQETARSAPDGYTLMNTPVATVANEFLSKTIKYEFGKDIMAVGPQAQTANILVVSPALGVKTLAELVKLAKEKPGVLQYATAGRGSATHLTSELFNMVAGIKTVPVHYRGGGDTIKDLLSGEVKMMFSSIAPVLEFVRDGRLVGLATTGPKRDPAFPDLPTVAESGYPGFDVRLWIGLTAPSGTPSDIIRKLADANRKALESPEIQKALAAQGFSPMLGSTEEFDAFYRAEREKWGKVVKETGMDKD
ncbi:MAG: tripartite tricarboxylate transporter substrate binding protein [Hyphomicrobiales bacterium]|nr:tripartite tricarboxylate transporter substrate binding protein [Alphaproteobacteria bacterium]